jgi:hypothetical protein
MSAEKTLQSDSRSDAPRVDRESADKFIESGKGEETARNSDPSVAEGHEPGWVDDPGRQRAAEEDPSSLYYEEGSDGAP